MGKTMTFKTNSSAPQPQGSEVAEWYRSENPVPVDVLHALAFMKAERDQLLAAAKRTEQYIHVAIHEARKTGAAGSTINLALKDLEVLQAAIERASQ